jgi:hypothetical protein
LWWAGFDKRPALFRLDPDTSTVTYYTLPSAAGEPVMVDARHNFIWYSDYQGRFGRLDPRKAAGATVAATEGAGALSLVECYQDWQPLSSASTSKSTSAANWAAGLYSTTIPAAGWQLYQLPEVSAARGPWGIRLLEDGLWVVDQQRQKLVNIPWQAPAGLVACKVEDAGGDPATSDDQTPLQNWPIDLRVDGVAQGITQTTGLDGCVAWDDLPPGPAYGLQEESPAGWLALTGTSHDFGPAISGGIYTHTFVNTQQVSVTACKLQDADGDLATTGDQTPLQNWALFLTVDGVRQEPGQLTGSDGCFTWNGLAPGKTYGLEETLAEGWLALTPVQIEFGPAVSGGAYQYSFVNAQVSRWFVYLPALVR